MNVLSLRSHNQFDTNRPPLKAQRQRARTISRRTIPSSAEKDHQMAAFDYTAVAELFPNRGMRSQLVGYRRFNRAADAIRFAIEELPPRALVGAWLEVSEERFDAAGIRRLYDCPDYPLHRGRPAMANREEHGDPKKGKPKKEVPKQPAQLSRFGRLPGSATTKTGAGKNDR